MTFKTVVKDMLNEFPEIKAEYIEEIKNGSLFEDSGPHIVFSYIFTPVLAREIKKGSDLAKRMLVFLETMSLCDDRLVMEVCDQSVLEDLCGEFADEEIYPLLGPDTREGYKAVRQYMGDKNTVLPSQRK